MYESISINMLVIQARTLSTYDDLEQKKDQQRHFKQTLIGLRILGNATITTPR